MTPPVINPTEFITFTLVLVRVSMILFLAPVFGSDIIPAQVKVALALVTSLLLTRVVEIDPSVYLSDIFSYVPLVLRELIIGLALSLMIRLILEGAQFAGQFIGYQMGFALANVIDPQTGAQNSVVAQLSYTTALLVFLTTNGHHMIVSGLVESFELAPPGLPNASPLALSQILAISEQFFIISIKLGAPALAILFLTKVCMGIIAKTVPQMNVLFVGMPLYIIIGLSTFGLSLYLFIPLIGRAVTRLNTDLLHLLRVL